MSDKKNSSSRLVKLEKCEFIACTERSRSIVNNHFITNITKKLEFSCGH